MLSKIIDRIFRKIYGGDLIMLVLYRPDQPEPNVVFHIHPYMRTEAIYDKCKELGDIIRREWSNRGGDVNA